MQSVGFLIAALFGVPTFLLSLLILGVGGAAIAWFLNYCLAVLPGEHRKVKEEGIWMLAIPFYGAVLAISALPKVSESFRSYFDSIGDTSVGDCAREKGDLQGIAWLAVSAMPIINIVGLIPIIDCLVAIVNIVVGLAALVILIVYGVALYELRGRVVSGSSGGSATESGGNPYTNPSGRAESSDSEEPPPLP